MRRDLKIVQSEYQCKWFKASYRVRAAAPDGGLSRILDSDIKEGSFERWAEDALSWIVHGCT